MANRFSNFTEAEQFVIEEALTAFEFKGVGDFYFQSEIEQMREARTKLVDELEQINHTYKLTD